MISHDSFLWKYFFSPVLRLYLGAYRFLDRHPMYASFGFVLFFSFIAIPSFLDELGDGRTAGELMPIYLFMYLLFTTFFVYGFKFMLWIMLRLQGVSDLRMKGED